MFGTIDDLDDDLTTFTGLLEELGRNAPLRDPLGSALEAAGLTAPQMHALLWLRLDQPLTMGQLAQRIDVSEKSVTGVVDRLERAGHLFRDRDAADRRVVHVRLTEAGQALAEDLDVQVKGKLRHFLELIDPEDRVALFRMLDKVLTRLKARDA